jgi:predicted AlkP superfamily phosphohydrolase/phosphomutase
LDNSADLIVGFNVPYRIDWESPIGGFSKDAVADNDRPWQADHIFDADFVPGVFFANFRVTRSPGVLDIAPTVLDFFGIDKPADYDGQSLLK